MPSWLATLLQSLTSTGFTAGTLTVLTFMLLAGGRLYTRGQVDRANTEHDAAIQLLTKQHSTAFEQQKAHYESRIKEIIAAKDESRQNVKDQLQQALTDKAAIQAALDLERGTKDAVVAKVMEEIVPLVQVTNKHLEGIEKLAEGGDP